MKARSGDCESLEFKPTVVWLLTVPSTGSSRFRLRFIYKPEFNISYKLTSGPSEDSDIIVFDVRLKTLWVLGYPQRVLRRLRSGCANAQCDLNNCWAHMQYCRKCSALVNMRLPSCSFCCLFGFVVVRLLVAFRNHFSYNST